MKQVWVFGATAVIETARRIDTFHLSLPLFPVLSLFSLLFHFRRNTSLFFCAVCGCAVVSCDVNFRCTKGAAGAKSRQKGVLCTICDGGVICIHVHTHTHTHTHAHTHTYTHTHKLHSCTEHIHISRDFFSR